MSEIALLRMACVFGDVVSRFLYLLLGLPFYSFCDGSPFSPLGASFQAGAVATLYRRRIRSIPSVRRKKTVRRCIYGGSYHVYRIYLLVGCHL